MLATMGPPWVYPLQRMAIRDGLRTRCNPFLLWDNWYLKRFLCCNICVQIWYATQCIEMQLVSWILLNILDVVAQVWYCRCSGGWVAWMGVAWMRCAQVRYIWLRFLDVMCPGMIYVVERPGCDVPRWDMCGWEASMLCAQEWRSKWKTMLSVTYRLNEKEKMGGSVFHMLYIFLLSGRNYCTYMLYAFGFEERLYI